jgi:hypothetical protein
MAVEEYREGDEGRGMGCVESGIPRSIYTRESPFILGLVSSRTCSSFLFWVRPGHPPEPLGLVRPPGVPPFPLVESRIPLSGCDSCDPESCLRVPHCAPLVAPSPLLGSPSICLCGGGVMGEYFNTPPFARDSPPAREIFAAELAEAPSVPSIGKLEFCLFLLAFVNRYASAL